MGALEVAIARVRDSGFVEYAVAALAIHMLMVLIRRPKNLPPGPIGLPIIGSLHLLGQRPHESLAQMARKYEPLMSLYMGQKLCIVASSAGAAMEFLKTHDSIFSSRPSLRGAEIIFPKDISFTDITPESRRMRKIFRLHLISGRSIEESEHIRADEVAQMVRSIPSGEVVNVKSCLDAMTANIFTRLIIGKRFMNRSGLMDKAEEQELLEFIEITDEIDLLLGTPNPRDVIPAFKWVDLTNLDRRYKNLRSRMESFLSKIIAEHRHRRENRTTTEYVPDFLDSLLDEMDTPTHGQPPLTEQAVTSIIWEAFAAGMETSALVSEWTMAEVLRNPEIQKKVQFELDEVVGQKRRVQESDLPKLKYLKAVVKEALRLHPIIPTLVPHQSNAACKAFGYDIPADTQLMVNVWAIGRDPSVWENALEFDPERFLGRRHAQTEYSGAGFDLLPFGSGRRMCLGMPLGSLLVETGVANLLHAFSWSIPTDLDMTEGVGLSAKKAVPLCAIACSRLSPAVFHSPSLETKPSLTMRVTHCT